MTDRYSIINIIKTYSYIEITILDSINKIYIHFAVLALLII